METTKPLSEYTAAELKALATKKEAVENAETIKRKKAYDVDKENFLKEVSEKFIEVKGILLSLKNDTITVAESLNALKYELEDKAVKEAKSFELKNDNIKITVENQDKFDFNDTAIVHINAIKDIFREKFEARNKGFYNLLDSILMKNSKGEYDAKLLNKARRQAKELGDDALMNEFDKLNDCLVVVGTAKYVRVYVKDEKNRWKDVSLSFSSL
jgi:formyltetrahydrofolate synthetase